MASMDERLRAIALKHGLLQQNDSQRVVRLVMPALRAVYDAGLERAAEIAKNNYKTSKCHGTTVWSVGTEIADTIRAEKEQAR